MFRPGSEVTIKGFRSIFTSFPTPYPSLREGIFKLKGAQESIPSNLAGKSLKFLTLEEPKN
jgi:hypothetical protein